MGVIIDSSVTIAAKRRRETPTRLAELVETITENEEAALSAIGLTELVHGIYRAPTTAVRAIRETFLKDLLVGFPVYPYTTETALVAGRIDGEQRKRGVTIPVSDLLIGATALSNGFSVLTANQRHFRLIPGLSVISI